MKLRYSARTDVGKKREINEDSYGPPELLAQDAAMGQLLVVCDGMGGHAAGEVASSLGVETIMDVYRASAEEDRASVLRRAFEEANQRIFEQGHGTMGTTGVAALLYQDLLYIANVGDSRAYLLHRGELHQVSRDHSYVAEQVQAGLLTPEQARTSLVRNIITRALGHQPDVKVDLFTVPLAEGDVVVLTSDGLYGLVDDSEIQQAIVHLPPEKATSALINLANQRGGVDNITVVVVKVERLDAQPVYDGTTHTLPVVNSAEMATERMPVAPPITEASLGTALSSNAHAPTDKFPTIIGQQVVRRDQPPPASPAPAPAVPASSAAQSIPSMPSERGLTMLGILLTLGVLVVLGLVLAVVLGFWSLGLGDPGPVSPPAVSTSAPTSAPTETARPSPTSGATSSPAITPSTAPALSAPVALHASQTALALQTARSLAAPGTGDASLSTTATRTSPTASDDSLKQVEDAPPPNGSRTATRSPASQSTAQASPTNTRRPVTRTATRTITVTPTP